MGGAEGAADAGLLIRHLRGGIPLLVDLPLGDHENVLGTSLHTQPAALAKISLKRYLCHWWDLLFYFNLMIQMRVMRMSQELEVVVFACGE